MLPTTLWKSFNYGINRSRNELDRVLEGSFRASETDQALLWEVYSGSEAILAAAMQELGLNTRIPLTCQSGTSRTTATAELSSN